MRPRADPRRVNSDGGADALAGFSALLEDSQELMMITAADTRLRWVSPSAARWLGRGAEGGTLSSILHPADRIALSAAVDSFVEGSAAVLRCRLRDASGVFHHVELTVRDRRGVAALGGLVCVARPASADPAAAAALLHQATHDTLTALPNRASLWDLLGSAGADDQSPLAVLYLDLDGFKAVNDSLGHAAGDRVLVSVAQRLRRAVRPGDTVARLHGDEFVVVAADIGDSDAAVDIAERVIASVRRPVAVQGRLVTVSASVGISVGSGSRADGLVEEADRAMFAAKRMGRNRCVLWTPGMGPGDVPTDDPTQ